MESLLLGFVKRRITSIFPLLTCHFFSSNIPSSPAYVVCISQLVPYARAYCKYQNFVDRAKLLTNKLLSQGYRKTKLVSTVKKFYGRHHDLVDPYSAAVSKLISNLMASVDG